MKSCTVDGIGTGSMELGLNELGGEIHDKVCELVWKGNDVLYG